MINQYCERLGPGLWQEPINAGTNIAFLLAALFSYKYYKNNRRCPVQSDVSLILLIVLLISIGIGSTLFHLFATPWAEIADSVPILTFVTVYLAIYFRRLAILPVSTIVGLLLVFHVFNTLIIFYAPRDILNGSLFYLPTWLSMLAISVTSNQSRLRSSYRIAVLTFSFSIALRSIDNVLCKHIPIGTHFFWHLINAWLLYYLVCIIIDNTRLHSAKDEQDHVNEVQ